MNPFDPDKDNEQVYDEKIYPLMKQIIEICKENNLPFFASFQYQEDGFCTTSILPEGCSKALVKAHNAMKPEEPQVFAYTITTIKK